MRKDSFQLVKMDPIAAAREVGYKPVRWRVKIREEVIELTRFVHTVLTAAQVPYFILFGTLLGATKWNSIIPWDDDSDIGILLEHVPAALKALQAALPTSPFRMSAMAYGYGLYGRDHGILDLIVFAVDPRTINTADPVYRSCYPLANGKPTFLNSKICKTELPSSLLFPLRQYLFEDMLLLGPAQGRELCLRKYGTQVYERNERPDKGRGIHPLVPYLLPPLTKVLQAIVDTVDRINPRLFASQ